MLFVNRYLLCLFSEIIFIFPSFELKGSGGAGKYRTPQPSNSLYQLENLDVAGKPRTYIFHCLMVGVFPSCGLHLHLLHHRYSKSSKCAIGNLRKPEGDNPHRIESALKPLYRFSLSPVAFLVFSFRKLSKCY